MICLFPLCAVFFLVHHSLCVKKFSLNIDYVYEDSNDSSPHKASDVSIDEEWSQFQQKHNKKYTGHEHNVRRAVFNETLNLINEHNLKHLRGEVSYKQKINYFADMTSFEVSKLFKGYQNYKNKSENKNMFSEQVFSEHVDLPLSVNWVEQKLVTPIKNQGHCGSCYAFSAIGSLEGQYAKKYNELISFSEQNIIDCSNYYGNSGCDGGLMDNVFEYVQQNGGLDMEQQYPYEGMVGTCRYIANSFTVSEHKDIKEGSESQLQKAVASIGPISVGIDASSNHFMHYSEGVYDDPDCSPTNLDHGVLVVGYGVEKGIDYWLVKNSWGPSWGENGYIKMTRGKNNQCGIASAASYPVL